MTILLGTVALEPNRWRAADPSGRPLLTLSRWMDRIAEIGFDGVEVWERHLTDADPAEAAALIAHPLPLTVFNTYASFDDDDPAGRERAAAWASRAHSSAVKFDVGNDPAHRDRYVGRLRTWLDGLDPGVVALCECHAGISIAEVPAVAAALLAAAGPPERVGAIVHTHEEPDHLRARFEAYGDRVRHVHVNFLDGRGRAPRLADVRGRLEAQVDLLQTMGFRGSWTLEFVHGVSTPDDRPARLVDQAAEDLSVLRDLVG